MHNSSSAIAGFEMFNVVQFDYRLEVIEMVGEQVLL